MIVLPILTLVLLFLFFFGKKEDFTRAIANTWICGTFGIWLMTELLSVFNHYNTVWVSVVWILYLVILGIMWKRFRIAESLKKKLDKDSRVRNVIKAHKGIIIASIVFAIFIFFTAAIQSQRNTDSMIYHLSRIMHWIDNESVRYYATDNDLQNRYPALTEFLVAQIYLSGLPDRLANLVQSVAYLAAGWMVFGIGRRLGASHKMAFVSTLIYWFLPMAMAQAYTTQTDNVAGMFLLTYIYFLLDFIRADKLQMNKKGFLAGMRLAACVMLGYLCKPTICFTMVVFFVWMCIVRLRKRDSWLVLLKYCLVGGVTALLLYTPLMSRSYLSYIEQKQESVVTQETVNNTAEEGFVDTTKQMLAPDSVWVKNGLLNPKVFAVTCIQNIGRNSGSYCFPRWNTVLEDIVLKCKDKLEVDVGTFYVQTGDAFFHDDMASAPAFMLFLAGICICSIIGFSKINKEQKIYLLCGVVSFIAQCGLMAYTIHRVRYLVGVMAVICPMIGIVTENIKLSYTAKSCVATALITIASFGAINTMGMNLESIYDSFRGDSINEYFPIHAEANENSCRELLNHINNNGYTEIGLLGKFTYEYVLWKEIDNLEEFQSVNVANSNYRHYEDTSYIPQCIITENAAEAEIGDTLMCHGVEYVCEWLHEGKYLKLVVYVPKG